MYVAGVGHGLEGEISPLQSRLRAAECTIEKKMYHMFTQLHNNRSEIEVTDSLKDSNSKDHQGVYWSGCSDINQLQKR